MRRRALVLLACVPLLTGGCLYLNDLSGFTSADAVDASSVESSTNDGGGDGAIDATADASSSNDAGGGVDASTAGDAAPFCDAGSHMFCDDFDDPSVVLPAPFDKKSEGGTLQADNGRSLSAPRSLHATVPRLSTSDVVTYATVSKYWASWHHVVLTTDIYLAGPDWKDGDSNVGLFELTLGSDTAGGVDVLLIADRDYTNVAYQTGVAFTGDPLPTNEWVHVVCDISPSEVTVTYGKQVAHHVFTPPLVPGNNPFTQLELGLLAFNRPIPAIDVRYDNLTVDFLPP